MKALSPVQDRDFLHINLHSLPRPCGNARVVSEHERAVALLNLRNDNRRLNKNEQGYDYEANAVNACCDQANPLVAVGRHMARVAQERKVLLMIPPIISTTRIKIVTRRLRKSLF